MSIINENNALLDTIQYYSKQLSGDDLKIKGYVNTIKDIENEKNNILNKKMEESKQEEKKTMEQYNKEQEEIKKPMEKCNKQENFDTKIEGWRIRWPRTRSPPWWNSFAAAFRRAFTPKPACDGPRRERDDFQRQVNDLNYNISKFKNDKIRCIAANDRVITKNNELIDTANYYNEQLFGYVDPINKNSIKGYIRSIMDSKNKNFEILNQKPGEKARPNISENFTSPYDTVVNENTIIQNQIKMDREKHSIDNKKYTNLVEQIELLKKIDDITSVILLIIIIISGTIIWFSDKSLAHKFVMVKIVWLYVILIEIVEYVLFYVYIYLRALLFGEKSTYNDYWNFPRLTWIDIVILVLIAFSVFI